MLTLKLYNTLRKIAAWGNQGNRMRTASTAFNTGNAAPPSNSTVTPSSTRPGYYSARRDPNSPGAQYRAQLDAKVKAMKQREAQQKQRDIDAEEAANVKYGGSLTRRFMWLPAMVPDGGSIAQNNNPSESLENKKKKTFLQNG